MPVRRVTRQELHALVWSRPMRDVAAEFGVSDVGLKKICLRHDIQPPKQGHWQRVSAGETISAPSLSVVPGDQAIVIYGADPAIEPKLLPEERERLEALLEREASPEFRISVPTDGERRHPMTRRIRKVLESRKPDDYGCLVCYEQDLPSVRVSPQNLPRALSIIDAVIKASERRGYDWQSATRRKETASLRVEGIALPIGLHETTQRRHHRLTPEEKRDAAKGHTWSIPMYDFVSTNQFSIRPHTFQDYVKDGSTRKVEERLNELMVLLIHEAFGRREDQRQWKLAEETRAGNEARRAEIQKLRKVEENEEGRLLAAAENWTRAQHLRRFIEAVEADSRLSDTKERSRWLSWAQAVADELDPLGTEPQSLFEVDFEAIARLQELEDAHDDD